MVALDQRTSGRVGVGRTRLNANTAGAYGQTVLPNVPVGSTTMSRFALINTPAIPPFFSGPGAFSFYSNMDLQFINPGGWLLACFDDLVGATIYDGGGNQITATNPIHATPPQTHLIGCTYDGATLRVFFDGSLMATAAAIIPGYTPSPVFGLGNGYLVSGDNTLCSNFISVWADDAEDIQTNRIRTLQNNARDAAEQGRTLVGTFPTATHGLWDFRHGCPGPVVPNLAGGGFAQLEAPVFAALVEATGQPMRFG